MGRNGDTCRRNGVPDEAYQVTCNVFGVREVVDLTIAIGLMPPITAWPPAFGVLHKLL